MVNKLKYFFISMYFNILHYFEIEKVKNLPDYCDETVCGTSIFSKDITHTSASRSELFGSPAVPAPDEV